MPTVTDHAGEVNRCCLCGTYNPRCLCPACFRRYSVGRVLPAWVQDLQREAQRITKRDQRPKVQTYDPVDIGTAIRRARLERGWSLLTLARQVDVEKTRLWRWERGRIWSSRERDNAAVVPALRRIDAVLQTTVADIAAQPRWNHAPIVFQRLHQGW